MIPKIIHHIWLGPKPMPEEFVRYGETWRKHHPEWVMWLWTDNNLPPLVNQDLYARGAHYSEKSDIIRYEVLNEFGGFYVDTDFECLKPLDEFLGWDFICGQQKPDYISTALIGCVRKNVITEEIIRQFPDSFVERPNDYMRRSVDILQRTISLHRHKLNLKVAEPAVFLPYNWNEKHRKGESFPGAYAVHHWAGSWG